jgi:hypothetical protein
VSILKTLCASALATVATLGAAGVANAGPAHIFYIMMENHAYGEIIGNTADAPFINQIVANSAVATQYYGVTHPSLPNYLAAMSGDFQGIWDDCKAGPMVYCAPEEFVPGSGDGTDGNYLTSAEVSSASNTPHWFSGQTIVDQLETAHKTWNAYFQSMPAGGYDVEYSPVINGTTVKLYAQKHNPFLYFSNIRNSQARLSHITPFETNFAADLDSGKIGDFVFIAPDQCHDMHGVSPGNAALINLPACGYPDSGLDHGAIQLGDAFLQSTVNEITNSKVWRQGRSAIVIVWDEDDYAGFAGCCSSPTGVNGVTLGGAQVPAIVITSHGPGTPQQFNGPANHYTLLGTIEALWNLPCLAETCTIPKSALMTSMFKNANESDGQ